MNFEQYLLTKVAEECAEIAQIALKAQQFGLENKKDEDTPTNRERLSDEINDLFVILSMLDSNGYFSVDLWDKDRALTKQAKVFKFLGISKDLGRVIDGQSGKNEAEAQKSSS